jgi:hypothetical protein
MGAGAGCVAVSAWCAGPPCLSSLSAAYVRHFDLSRSGLGGSEVITAAVHGRAARCHAAPFSWLHRRQRCLLCRSGGYSGATDVLSAVFMAITARKMSTTRRSWLYRRDYGYSAATFRFFAAFMALSAWQEARHGRDICRRRWFRSRSCCPVSAPAPARSPRGSAVARSCG